MKLFPGDIAEVKLPVGLYPVAESLEWGVIYGGHLEGTGGVLQNSEHKPNKGTRIVHGFDKTQPTLVYSGFGGRISRVTFSGDPRIGKLPRDERADIGLVVDKVENPPSGLGTGKLLLDDVCVTNYKRGIQLGWIEPGQDQSTEDNSDNLDCLRLFSHSCDTMLRVEHEQGVDVHIAVMAHPYQTDLVFDFEGGGNLFCQVLRCLSGVKQILRTGRAVGSNNAKYAFGHVLVDTNNDVPIFVVQEKVSTHCEFTFGNVRIGNSTVWPSVPIFQLQGGSSLKLDGFKRLKNRMIRFRNSGTYRNHIILADVIVETGDLADLFSMSCNGVCDVTVGAVRGAYSQRRIPSGDYTVTAAGGVLTVVARTPDYLGAISAAVAELTEREAWLSARVAELEAATPVDIAPLEARIAALESAEPVDMEPLESRVDHATESLGGLIGLVSEIERAVHSSEERLDSIGTAFRQAADDLLPVDGEDGANRL